MNLIETLKALCLEENKEYWNNIIELEFCGGIEGDIIKRFNYYIKEVAPTIIDEMLDTEIDNIIDLIGFNIEDLDELKIVNINIEKLITISVKESVEF